MAKWTPEEKLKALALADVATCAEASKETGIPQGTIKRWRMETRASEPNDGEPNRTERTYAPKRIRELTEEAAQRVQDEVSEYIEYNMKALADQYKATAKKALDKLAEAMDTGPREEEPMAAWVRALVGAADYALKDSQLLEGKPTERQEVRGEVTMREEHTYHVIQEIIAKDDEVANRLLEAFARPQK